MILVSIQCLVYNHARYLRQCLDGFIMQKTDFKFEAIVHDDLSTDESAKIIAEYAEKYPEIIKPIYETENQYAKGDGSLARIMNGACKGEYIALCEGDDYWIDPNKLQKQVDYMKMNPQCGMVHGIAKVYEQKNRQFKGYFGSPFNSVEELFKNNTISTPTVLIKRSIVTRYMNEVGSNNNWQLGDYPLWLFASLNENVGFISHPISVYRVLSDSASHSTNYGKKMSFVNSVFDMKDFFAKKYAIASSDTVCQMRFATCCSFAISYDKLNDAIVFYKKIKNPTFGLTFKYLLARLHMQWMIRVIRKIKSMI